MMNNASARPTASHQSVLVHHNLMLLPETPMTPRYADPRVGYFDWPTRTTRAQEPDVVDGS